MSDLAEKLENAGVDTIGARLTTACTDAIRKHPDSVADAWRYVGAVFGHEFVRGLMSDMQPKVQTAEPNKAFDKISAGLNEALDIARGTAEPGKLHVPTPKPYQPRVIPPERLEKRRELRQVVRSKYMNSGGISWSEVGCHEALGLLRDGKEVEALLAACPANIPNDGRTFGDVLSVKKVDEIIAQVRAGEIRA
jgi:hypothetical protein